jgi:ATP-dependent Clp protease protease subunit
MKEAQIFIDGEITPQTTLEVKDMLARSQAADSFCIHISSNGGSVYDGYKIFHAIRNAATSNGVAKPVRAVIEGEAQSMATIISMAADKGSIEIANPSRYMIHNPSMGVKGTATDFTQGASELLMIQTEMGEIYSQRTGIPIEEINKMMAATTTMTAEEAVRLGFADKLSTHLRAVAKGIHPMEEKKNFIEKLITAVTGPAKAVPPPGEQQLPVPKKQEVPIKSSVDAPLQDGTVLSIDAPNEDSLVGAPATINGAPAPDGDYPCNDGDVITVMGGVVTMVTTAMDALAKKNTELQAKLDALSPQVAKVAEQEKVISEVKETAKALSIQVNELKSKTVGTDNRPFTGNEQPNASSGPSAEAQKTAQFLGEFMPWLEQYNTKRGNSPVLGAEIKRNGPQAVSILETSFNYTYPGILTTDIYYKPTLDTPALSDLFTIDQGIQFRKKYNLVTQLSNLLQPYGGCTRVFNGNRQLVTNTTVEVKEFQLSESWCKDDFTGQLTGVYNILAQEWLKTGNASFDPTGTPISAVIDQILSDALRRDVFQRVSFGAGNSSSNNYNQIDGLWDRLIDSSGASNYCVVRGGSALGVGTLSANAALTALEAVYAASNPLLKQMIGKAKFYVTGSIYDNYVQSLVMTAGTANISAPQFLNTITGTGGKTTTGGGITYKGIEVVPIRFWDSSLADTNNPLNATTRHLILLTVKENHILGVENGPDLNRIDGWYERKDRKFYYESDMKFGYNYLHCDLQAIAF